MGNIVHSAHPPLLSLSLEAKGSMCFYSQRDATDKLGFLSKKPHASLETFAPAFLMLLGSGGRQLIILEYGVTASEYAELILGGWCQLEGSMRNLWSGGCGRFCRGKGEFFSPQEEQLVTGGAGGSGGSCYVCLFCLGSSAVKRR